MSHHIRYKVAGWAAPTAIVIPSAFAQRTVAPLPSPTNAAMKYAPAPTPVSANFDPSGNSIFLVFDRPVKLVQMTAKGEVVVDTKKQFLCNVFIETRIDPTSVFEREGFPQDCNALQTSLNTFRLLLNGQLGREETNAVQPYDPIYFKDNVIRDFNAQYSYSTTVFIKDIQPPKDMAMPLIGFRGPKIIDSCSDLVINIANLGGSAGRAWLQVELNFDSSSQDVADDYLKEYLLQESESLRLGASQLFIPRDYLSSRDYSFIFTVANFLNGRNSFRYNLTKVVGDAMPPVVLRIPPGSIRIDRPLSVMAAVGLSQCNSASPVEFEWMSTTFPISSSRNRGSAYFIEPFTLSPGTTYSIIAQVNYVGATTKYNFTTTFTTEEEKLKVIAGPSTSIMTNRLFNIVPVIRSVAGKFNATRYTCSWSCTDQNTTLACAGLTLPSVCSSVPIPADTLSAGIYRIDLNVTSKSSGSVTTGSPAFLTAVAPVVNNNNVAIQPAFLQVDIYNSEQVTSPRSQKFYLLAIISESTGVYSWSSEATCFGSTYAVLNMDATTLATPLNSPVLKFQSDVLVPGASYCFKATVTSNGVTGVAYTTVSVMTGPASGFCSLTNNVTTVAALDQAVNITCNDWVTYTTSYPLRYAFQWARETDTEYSMLRPLSEDPTLSVVLPPGTFKFRAMIVDAVGSTAYSNDEMTIVSSASLLQKRDFSSKLSDVAMRFMNSSYANFNLTGDSSDAVLSIGMIADLLRNQTGASNEVKVRDYLLNFMKGLVNSKNVIIDETVNAPFFASIISNLAGSISSFNGTVVGSLTSVLKKIVADATTNSAGDQSCFSGETATDVYNAVSSLTALLQTKNMYNSVIASDLGQVQKSLVACLGRTLTCGQNDLALSGEAVFNQTIGVQNTTQTNNFCNGAFKFTTVPSSVSSEGCAAFSCLSSSAAGLSNVTLSGNLTALAAARKSFSFSYANGTAMSSVSLGANERINFTISVPSGFWAANGVQASVTTYSPVCGVYTSDTVFSTTGCSVVSVSNLDVTCSCNSIGTYGVGIEQGVKLVADPTTSTTTAVPVSTASVPNAVPTVVAPKPEPTVAAPAPSPTNKSDAKQMAASTFLVLFSFIFSLLI